MPIPPEFAGKYVGILTDAMFGGDVSCCLRCGAVVATIRIAEHSRFHDFVDAIGRCFLEKADQL